MVNFNVLKDRKIMLINRQEQGLNTGALQVQCP